MSLLELHGGSAPGKAREQQVQHSSAGRVLGAREPQWPMQLEQGCEGQKGPGQRDHRGLYSENEGFNFHKNYMQTVSSKSGKKMTNSMFHRVSYT